MLLIFKQQETLRLRFFLVLLTLCLISCAPATNYIPSDSREMKESLNIGFSFKVADEFVYLDKSLKPDSWGTLIFGGTVGLLLSRNNRENADKENVDGLYQDDQINYSAIFFQKIKEGLLRTGRISTISPINLNGEKSPLGSHEAILNILVTSWGIKKTQYEDKLILFITSKVELNSELSSVTSFSDRSTTTMTVPHSLFEYENNYGLLNSDLGILIDKASKDIIHLIVVQ